MEKFRTFIGKIPTGLLTGITVIAILWLTLAPHPTGDLEIPLFPGADKVVHMIMFGFLTFIVLLELMKRNKWHTLSLASVGIVAFICAIFGIGIEIIQGAMGLGRSFELLDIIADSAGAMMVAGIWAALQNILAVSDE